MMRALAVFYTLMIGFGVALWIIGFLVVLDDQRLLGSILIVVGGMMVGWGALAFLKAMKS